MPIFFPEPQVLEETECDHRQQNVMVQGMPVPALTMIEPQLFLHLLVPLLTDPARLDGGHQLDQGGLSRMIGHVEFALIGAPLTNQPDLGARQVATRAQSRSIGHPDAHGGEVAPHSSLGSGAPGHAPEGLLREGGDERGAAFNRRNRVCGRASAAVAAPETRRWDRHAGSTGSRRHRSGHAPPARLETPPLLRIPQHASERHPGAAHPVDLVQGDLPLWLSRNRQGHRGGAAPVKIHSSGKYKRRPRQIGTSSWANVVETRTWQLAVLPSWLQYWCATPTECSPFFINGVSSITRTASGPPTRRLASSARSSSSGEHLQGAADRKFCSGRALPGETRSAIASTLLRSPGPSRPCTYNGIQRRCATFCRRSRKGDNQFSRSFSQSIAVLDSQMHPIAVPCPTQQMTQ